MAKQLDAGRREIDMTKGPLLGKILKFSLPVVLTNLLQLLFNAADTIIVGRFDGSLALAAVGATSAVIFLITNLFMGLSLGTGVAVAQHKGAGEETAVSETVHTSMLTSVVGGILVCITGLLLAEPLLTMMKTPGHIIGQSLIYIRIYFIGIPSSMVYNFGAAIHRAVGDTRRPLYFLSLAGVINVVLNLFFVIALHMGVAGVALATVISQTISAALITLSLGHADGCYRLCIRRMRIYWDKLGEVMKVGIPAGLQNSLFSVSNVLIQSSINSFGQAAMAAHTAAMSLEGFMNSAVAGVADASTNFTGQNIGAGKYKRVRRVCTVCGVASVAISVLLGALMLIFGEQLLGLYNKEPEVIKLGLNRIYITATTYAFFALMQVFAGCLRGMGRSMMPTVVSVLGICGLRIVYIYTIFAMAPSLVSLYISYPVSWLVSMAANMICYFIVSHRLISGKWTPDLIKNR